MAKATEYEIALHQRLLKKEETASSELCMKYLDSLVSHFKNVYSKDSRCDSELINDAVTDSLLKLIDDPSKFNPELSILKSYLRMSVDGDIRNMLDKKKRKLKLIRGKLGESVELEENSRNIIVEEREDNPEQRMINKEIDEHLRKLFDNEKDYELANLILSGERKTLEFVDILNIADLPREEQEKEVKRAKDRIKAKIKRANPNLRKLLE